LSASTLTIEKPQRTPAKTQPRLLTFALTICFCWAS
jgi:hypothetical protein